MGMEAPEKYVPTEEEKAKAIIAEREETEKAEEMLGSAEAKLSKDREARVTKFEEAGITGDLKLSSRSSLDSKNVKSEISEVVGNINGNPVFLRQTYRPEVKTIHDGVKPSSVVYEGTVNGQAVLAADAQKAWDKYVRGGFAMDSSAVKAENQGITEAIREKTEEARRHAEELKGQKSNELLSKIGL